MNNKWLKTTVRLAGCMVLIFLIVIWPGLLTENCYLVPLNPGSPIPGAQMMVDLIEKCTDPMVPLSPEILAKVFATTVFLIPITCFLIIAGLVLHFKFD